MYVTSSTMAELQETALPPGWECKLDGVTGKYYFINHATKTTTWDDPRLVRRQFHGTPKHFQNIATEHIPLQHGSLDLRRNYVYPSQTSPIPAFQMSSHQNHKSINPLQELRHNSRSSPLSGRGARVQDSSMTIQPDSDDAVSKISAMFPTVSETHIRLLMKKYHSREALVISALQVEKNPITTPGPFATPPPQRNIHHPSVYALHMTPPLGLRTSSRGGSPILRPGSGTNSTGSPRIGDAFRSSPRPHSSPKLKLRYMKSLFPQAEETLILDALYNNDNNIQKTSEILKEMGFQKKETPKVVQPKVERQIETENKEEAVKPEPATVTPKVKTAEEKAAIKEMLKEKYKDMADHLISIALESVDFDEKRAGQILEIMVQENTIEEEAARQTSSSNSAEEQERVSDLEPKQPDLPVSQSRHSIKSLLKSEKTDKLTYNRFLDKAVQPNNIKGPNPDFTLGPNDKLLLEDYINWQGPNPSIRRGPQSLQKGPNRSLLGSRSYQTCGSNPELRKGPKFGLAKGSIVAQLKSVVVGECRSD